LRTFLGGKICFYLFSGKMFHVDFGFILGRDPKPMPPPMKLTSEMINAMGGQNRFSFYFFNVGKNIFQVNIFALLLITVQLLFAF